MKHAKKQKQVTQNQKKKKSIRADQLTIGVPEEKESHVKNISINNDQNFFKYNRKY